MPEQGINQTCENQHTVNYALEGYTRDTAVTLAAFLDGTSDIYKYKPADDPTSTIGRCGLCGSPLTCTVYGYEDEVAN